jgi:proteasome lid subunit RPN8/RPN11
MTPRDDSAVHLDHLPVAEPERSSAPAIVLSPERIAEIRQHAREAYPHECCGILLGEGGDRVTVRSVHRTDNVHADERARDRYEVDPREILRLDRSAEAEDQQIVGFYHSHPEHPPLPSATDRQYAWPGYVYVIVSLTRTGEGEVRSWSYRETDSRFVEWAVVLQDRAGARGAGASVKSGQRGG